MVFTLLGPQLLHWSLMDLTGCWLCEQTARAGSHRQSQASEPPHFLAGAKLSHAAEKFQGSPAPVPWPNQCFPHLISSCLAHNSQTLGLKLRNLVTQRESSCGRPLLPEPFTPGQGRALPDREMYFPHQQLFTKSGGN